MSNKTKPRFIIGFFERFFFGRLQEKLLKAAVQFKSLLPCLTIRSRSHFLSLSEIEFTLNEE